MLGMVIILEHDNRGVVGDGKVDHLIPESFAARDPVWPEHGHDIEMRNPAACLKASITVDYTRVVLGVFALKQDQNRFRADWNHRGHG